TMVKRAFMSSMVRVAKTTRQRVMARLSRRHSTRSRVRLRQRQPRWIWDRRRHPPNSILRGRIQNVKFRRGDQASAPKHIMGVFPQLAPWIGRLLLFQANLTNSRYTVAAQTLILSPLFLRARDKPQMFPFALREKRTLSKVRPYSVKS